MPQFSFDLIDLCETLFEEVLHLKNIVHEKETYNLRENNKKRYGKDFSDNELPSSSKLKEEAINATKSLSTVRRRQVFLK